MTITGRAKLGALPEGIAFSPHSDDLYVGNYIDKTLQVFPVNNGKPIQVDDTVTLPGQPASMRGLAR